MARIHLSEGACPVCDAPVLRTVHLVAGLQREVYHCHLHGRLEYADREVPLDALNAIAFA